MLFVARALGSMAGGVERMITTIMNEMTARGHQVGLFSWDLANAEAFYPIAPGVPWYKLDMGDPGRKAGVSLLLRRAGRVRDFVREFRPDVIVCFQGGPFMAMRAFTVGMGVPIVAAERTAPTLYEFAGTSRHKFAEHQAFRLARLITVQFERYRELYPAYLRRKIVAVPNPVRVASRHASPAVPSPGARFTLLSVARLGYQKNIEILVDAFAELAPRFPDWDLRVVGEGENRQSLLDRVARFPSLAGRVNLPGARSDVESEYAAAHLFCLSARWEGFPNALAEALAHGLPSVGFEGCAGVSDLIVPGQTGELAAGNGDARTLADALALLMADAAGRARMGQAAVLSMQTYAPATIFDLWERTLLSAKRH